MLAFVAIIGIVGFTQTKSESPIKSQLAAPTRRLSKPETGMLLHRTDLSLSETQRLSLLALDSAWERDKTKLLQAMSGYEPREGRADQIRGSLEGYSELSRTFDATRSRYWAKASALLDKRQRTIAEGDLK